MSTDITPFRSDCEHVLQRLPAIDMTLRFVCGLCGGIRETNAGAILDFGSYEALTAAMLAELGGTLVNERTEPRRSEYPIGGSLLNTAGIGFIEYLDAWVDKGIADGTLTIEKGAQYREAIAARCAELGEVPGVREHIVRLDLKAGDILAVIAPYDSVPVLRQMGEHVKQFLDYVGVDGVEVAVFPAGTELRVMEGAGSQVSDKIREYVDAKVRDGAMTPEQFRERLAQELKWSLPSRSFGTTGR